jgi:hypothetical protein
VEDTGRLKTESLKCTHEGVGGHRMLGVGEESVMGQALGGVGTHKEKRTQAILSCHQFRHKAC